MSIFTDLLQITYLVMLFNQSPMIQAQELYTSLVEMEPLVKTQKCVIDSLDKYIKNDRKRIYVLRENMKHFKEQHKKAMQDVQNYLENPVNAYTLIKRLTTDLDFLERTIRLRTEYKKVFRMTFPKQQDLDGALQALIRLQRTYGLNVTQFASGTLFGNQSSSLTSFDCFMIGALEYKETHFNETIMWMEEALHRYKTEQETSYPFTEFNITEHIIYSYLAMDEVDKALEWNNKMKLNDTDPRYLNSEQLLQRHRDFQARRDYEFKVMTNNRNLKITVKKELTDRFNKLCRGDQSLPGYLVKRLKCRYFTGHHPFLRLAPLKVEQLYIKPNVYMFHGVLSDSEIDRLKTLAKPLLHRGLIISTKPVATETRIVQIAWLTDSESSTVEKVTRRVGDMTGLHMASSESLQVGNYGIGGYYQPHHDDYDVGKNRTYNNERARTTTVIFYLHRGLIISTKPVATETRIVQIAWLTDSESSTVEKVTRRVGDMTGLNMASSEVLQVGNYGIGGYYEPHYDVDKNRTNNNERARTATVIFYLTDVEQGGATVFLQLGLTVFPVKGSALFWKNLDSSGYPDYSSFHGACPVLQGSKWVATKWLTQLGQELIRPCKLKEDNEDSSPKHHKLVVD